MPSKKVFLTGGEGLIGSHLKTFLLSKDYQVSAPLSDICKYNELKESFSKDSWDYVIHLAGLSAYDFTEKNPDLTFNTNVTGTMLLAHLCAKYTPQARLIFTSTAQIYKAPAPEDAKQDIVLTESSPVAPRSVYGESKWQAELLLKDIALRLGLKTTVLRLFNHTHKTQSRDLFLPSVYEQLKSDNPSVTVGNIDVKRDVGAVSDLVQAFLAVMESPQTEVYNIFNVCSGRAVMLRELIEVLAKQMNRPYDLKQDQSKFRPNDPISICGSFEKLAQSTRWKPSVTTTEALIQDFLKDFL